VYQYSSYITEINGSLILLASEITDLSLLLSEYLDGTYYFIVVAHNNYGNTLSNCIQINVEIPPLPGDFTLSSNAEEPDPDGNFDLVWTTSSGAVNYSIYRHSTFITVINGSLTLLADEITELTLSIIGYSNDTYYFIVVAHNIYGNTLSNCIQVNVKVPPPPGDFTLSSNAENPDPDGNFEFIWTASSGAVNFSIYQYLSYITEINGSLTLLANEITDLTLPLNGYSDGTYYFIVVAHNEYGDTLSNCIQVNVELALPPGDFTLSSNAGIPDTDGSFTLSWTSSTRSTNYSVYCHSGYITEINGSLSLLAEEISDVSLLLSGYSDGTYYFIIVAYNEYGDKLSNCIMLIVEISKSLIIISPISSSSFNVGTSQSLSWSSSGAIPTIKIELYKDGSFVMEITSETGNDGEYMWIVFSDLETSNQYQIKISDRLNPLIFDFSDQFEIKGSAPTEPPAILGYNIYLLIGTLGITSLLLIKMRKKHK